MALIRTLPHDSLYVFPNENGAPHCPNSWSQKLKRLMRKLHAEHIEIPVVTAHELRHTYGTYLRRHGADIYTIQNYSVIRTSTSPLKSTFTTNSTPCATC